MLYFYRPLFKAPSSGAASMGSALDSRTLSQHEVQALKKGELPEIEFEGYLVEIDQFVEKAKNDENSCNGGSGNKVAGYMQPPKLKKFKVPSQVVHREPTPASAEIQSGGADKGIRQSNVITGGSFGRRSAYKVDEDELDDIWGTSGANSEHHTDVTTNADKDTHLVKRRRDIWGEYSDIEETDAGDKHEQTMNYSYKYCHDDYEYEDSVHMTSERQGNYNNLNEYGDDNHSNAGGTEPATGIVNSRGATVSPSSMISANYADNTSALLKTNEANETNKVNIWGDSDSD